MVPYIDAREVPSLERLVIPSHDFDATVSFFGKTADFRQDTIDGSEHDAQSPRRAIFRPPNGVLLVVVETAAHTTDEHLEPRPSFTVSDVVESRHAFEDIGIEFMGPITETHTGAHWTDFREPGGAILRLQTEAKATKPVKIVPGIEGVDWNLLPSTRFDETVRFAIDTLKLPLEEQGVPVTDPNFHRYARFRTGNDVVLEVVEPKPQHRRIFRGPVPAIHVTNLTNHLDRMKEHHIEVRSPIVHGEGLGWFYFRVPGSGTFQYSGPYRP